MQNKNPRIVSETTLNESA